jgi:PKD repeat protein
METFKLRQLEWMSRQIIYAYIKQHGGKLMNIKTIIILTMVTLALTLPLASASDWTQFHCDVEHTGYSTSNAPAIYTA